MEPTLDYQAFGLGIIVGAIGLIIFVRIACLVADWIQRHIERRLRREAEERYERMKQMIVEDTIKQLEDHANWKDEE